ncbi:NUDIX domain-containing protein [Ochrobactrum sp. SFR4]|uniref:NUDIX domain-containing protein n=1 Tax=Ochrobactrum sp. SFR4 TaxID=2717368 RepID=UPI001C8C1C72|nr:NUDIX domain-containing protein [Ochrobactrum sp. SFR4]MBX8826199.1 NUDIX domain-containing protein [Ochrobactrum sp. SFR4]
MRRISNVALYRDGRILLGKRSPHRRVYANCWALFGGHLEVYESPAQAAIRELREELSIQISDLQFVHQFETAQITMTVYACNSWSGELQLLDDEHSEMRWFDPVQAMTLPDLALPEYRTTFEHLSRLI